MGTRTHNKYTGHRFGHLVAGQIVSRARYAFTCDCGTFTVKNIQSVRATVAQGRSPHCGCRAKETVGGNNRSHGLSSHPLYSIWQSMTRGAKIASVTPEWRQNPTQFVADMYPSYPQGQPGQNGYKPGIRRKNAQLPYSKDNCYWAPGYDKR